MFVDEGQELTSEIILEVMRIHTMHVYSIGNPDFRDMDA